MGKAIPYDFRIKIVQRIKQGEGFEEVAEETSYSVSGIKKIWYAYKREGENAFHNKYSNCGKSSPYDSPVRNAVIEIRDNNQGGTYVRSKLKQKHPELVIPHERTLQRWWACEGSNRAKGRPTDTEKKIGAKNHMKHGK